MNYFIYITSFLYTLSAFSQTEIVITENVEAGATDIQHASSIIEATNSIESDATTVYKAGESILLTEGFFADLNSNVFMTIEENLASSSTSQKEVVSLNEPDLLANEFSIYPNPSTGLFTVQGSSLITSYHVNNLMGQQVIFKESLNLNTANIDISTFASGVYFIEILKENGEIVKQKIIKN